MGDRKVDIRWVLADEEGRTVSEDIDLEASLARFRALVEAAAGDVRTVVTLRVSPATSAGRVAPGPDWDPDGRLAGLWRSQAWVVSRDSPDREPPAPRSATPGPPAARAR